MLQPLDTLRTKNKLPGVSETWIGQQEKLSPNLFANQTNQAFILISSDPNNFNLGVCEKACRVLLICVCSFLIFEVASGVNPYAFWLAKQIAMLVQECFVNTSAFFLY